MNILQYIKADWLHRRLSYGVCHPAWLVLTLLPHKDTDCCKYQILVKVCSGINLWQQRKCKMSQVSKWRSTSQAVIALEFKSFISRKRTKCQHTHQTKRIYIVTFCKKKTSSWHIYYTIIMKTGSTFQTMNPQRTWMFIIFSQLFWYAIM